MKPEYTYRATLHRVVDGDTYELSVDVGFRITSIVMVRLNGYNAPELDTPEGVQASTVALEVMVGKELLVQTHKGPRSGTDRMSFARWIADVYLVDKSVTEGVVPLGEILVQRGVAEHASH